MKNKIIYEIVETISERFTTSRTVTKKAYEMAMQSIQTFKKKASTAIKNATDKEVLKRDIVKLIEQAKDEACKIPNRDYSEKAMLIHANKKAIIDYTLSDSFISNVRLLVNKEFREGKRNEI